MIVFEPHTQGGVARRRGSAGRRGTDKEVVAGKESGLLTRVGEAEVLTRTREMKDQVQFIRGLSLALSTDKMYL